MRVGHNHTVPRLEVVLYFSCVEGFFGEPMIPGGNCSRCQCNNNSDVCNTTTGECLNCQYNTTGFNCERCENGTWGNATQQQCQGKPIWQTKLFS